MQRANIRQVAERAGVSKSTVSNVLLGRHDRSTPETFEAVIRAARELDYVPVKPMLQNRHIETRVIGVSMDQVVLGEDYSAMHIYRGLSLGAARLGYDLLMMLQPLPDWAPDLEEVQFLDRRSDGYILVAPLKRQGLLQTLVDNRIPAVACFSEDVPDGVGWVTGNNREFVRQALDHLIEHGHRRIAFLDGCSDNSDIRRRGEHFEELAGESGLTETHRITFPAPGESYGPVLDAIVASGATAVLCSNDEYALKVWALASERGVRVPEKLSIVGIDGYPEAAAKGLTTVELDFKQVASVAVDCWIALVKGGDWREQRRYVSGTLAERGTVTVPRPEIA